MRIGTRFLLAISMVSVASCSNGDARVEPSASAAPTVTVRPDDAALVAASARASFALPAARPIASGAPLGVELPRAVSITLPPGFTQSDSGYQFVKASRGDVELTLVAGIDKGALGADADLADTFDTDARSIARRYDVASLQGVIEALPVETDGAGKTWEKLHFRAWTDVANGQGLRIVVNLRFPAGTRAAHEQEFADVLATLKVGPAPTPQPEANEAAAASGAPLASAAATPDGSAVSGSSELPKKR